MSGYLLAGLVLGAVLFAIYVWRSTKARKGLQLEMAAALLLSSISVAAGVKLIEICVTADSLKPFADEDRAYIILGGIALVWVSVQAIWNIVR